MRMEKVKRTIKKYLPSKRKVIQLYFALLYNANLQGFVKGRIFQGDSKNLCVPGLNCYSCPGAIAACPLGSLQGSLSADRSTFYYVGGILLLFGILFGRMICGYACPFGLIQELLFKIKTPKVDKNVFTRIASYFKYVILFVFVFVIPLAYAFKDTPLPAFCKYICPAGTLEGGISLLVNKANESFFSMLGPIFTWKFALLVGFIVGSVFVFRLFCRFFCPLGALYGLFNKFSIFGIRLDEGKCISCSLCVSGCKLDIKNVGDHECIGCGDCVSVCPTGAISYRGGKLVLASNVIDSGVTNDAKPVFTKIIKVTTALVMAIALTAAITYSFMASKGVDVGTNESGFSNDGVPVGTEIGDRCYGYSLELFDGNGLTGETLDPTKTGEVTVINFWGTWCTPCVNELPYFEQIAHEYNGYVTVVAIHTDLLFNTAPEYVAKYYNDTEMYIAKDFSVNNAGGYYTALGGRGSYPYTLILDSNGIIKEIYYSSVTYDELKTAVEKLID